MAQCALQTADVGRREDLEPSGRKALGEITSPPATSALNAVQRTTIPTSDFTAITEVKPVALNSSLSVCDLASKVGYDRLKPYTCLQTPL